MDFKFGPEEEAFRQEIREFVRRELPSDWLGLYEEEYTPEVWDFTRSIAKKLGERRWLGLGWPKEYGGQEAPLIRQMIFQEEAAYWGIPGTGMGVGGTAWVGPSILLFGTEEQKKRFVPPIALGEEFWCTGYSEPGAGSDLAALTTRAVPKNGEYIVDGQKVWTSAAHIADWCWLAVRTDPSATKHRGITVLMVKMDSPGITVRPLINLAGLHSFNEVYFDGVRVPKENRLGEENQGWYYIVKALDMERAWPGIRASAIARRALDELVKFIRASGIKIKEAHRHELVQAAIEAEAGRLLGYRVVHMMSRGTIPNYESSLVKVFGSELVQRISILAMKIFGLYCQLEPGSPYAPLKGWFERLYLVAPGNNIAAGTSEIQRNIIAQRGLGLPRD